MTDRSRSPFGELVHALRKQRTWTQARLALEATQYRPVSAKRIGITERSIGAIEYRTKDASAWVSPRQETVNALAVAFGLQAGDAAHTEFLQAAVATRQAIRQSRPAEGDGSLQRRFVPAGREPHLTRIAGAITRIRQGTPQLLLVGADAGTGKTWLIQEACRQAVHDVPDLVVLWGNCQGHAGMPDPYLPFRQILREMVGETRSTSPQHLIDDENLARIQARIPATLMALSEGGRDLLHRLLPISALGNAIVLDSTDPTVAPLVENLSAQPAPHHVIDPGPSLRHLLSAYAREGPVVLVLEDLHTGDTATLELLATLLRETWLTDIPLLVLASFRPVTVSNRAGTEHPLSPFLQSGPDLHPDPVVDLSSALTPAAGREFIAALAEDMDIAIDPEEMDRIQQQTLGLPIFVEGVLRLYQESAPGYGPGEPVGERSQVKVFDAEIGLLSPPARRALLAASVQGASFSLETLASVLDTPIDDLTALLDGTPFRRMGLLQPGGISTINGQDIHEFQFSHALLRDHLYGACLSDLERAHWHLRTARALTDLSDVPSPETQTAIAYHLEQAGETIPAAEAWLQVARAAIEENLFDQAEQALHRVREQHLRLAAPALETEALLLLGLCARGLDRRADATRWLDMGLELARRRRLPQLEARLLSQLGMLAYDVGQVERGAELLRSSITLNEQTGDLAEAARSLARLSHNLHGLGKYEAAMREARRSLDLAATVGDELLACGASIALANCWLDLGRFDIAITLYETTLSTCGRLGDVHRSNICLLNIALCQIEQEAWMAAATTLLPFQSRDRPVVPRFVAVVEFQAGLIAEGQGQWELAQQHFQESMDIRQRNGQAALLIDAMAGLLRVATARREATQVRRLIAEIDARVARHGLDGIEHAARVCLAMIGGGLFLDDRVLTARYAETGLAFLARRAGAITDAADRHRYLELVPSHRRLRVLAAEVLEEPSPGFPSSIASD